MMERRYRRYTLLFRPAHRPNRGQPAIERKKKEKKNIDNNNKKSAPTSSLASSKDGQPSVALTLAILLEQKRRAIGEKRGKRFSLP